MREWAQTAAMRRDLLIVITIGHVMKSEGGCWTFHRPGWATGNVAESL